MCIRDRRKSLWQSVKESFCCIRRRVFRAFLLLLRWNLSVVLRDAHQSLLATRMTMDEMRPILPEMDKINYFSDVYKRQVLY